MKIFLTLGWLVVTVSVAWGATESWQVKDLGRDTGRTLTLLSEGEKVYARTEFDPRLFGEGGADGELARVTESFLVGGKPVLSLKHYKSRIKSVFMPYKDYVVAVDDQKGSELRIVALSYDEKKEYSWTKGADGYYSIFKVRELEFTEKERKLIEEGRKEIGEEEPAKGRKEKQGGVPGG